MDCSPPSSSVHGILARTHVQGRILHQVAISSSRGSFRPRDQTLYTASPALTGEFFTWATWEANLTTNALNKAARHLKYKAESWDWWCPGSVSCQGLAGVEGVWQGLQKEEERYYWWTGLVLRDRVIQIEGWGKCDAMQFTGQTYFFLAQGFECCVSVPTCPLASFYSAPNLSQRFLIISSLFMSS